MKRKIIVPLIVACCGIALFILYSCDESFPVPHPSTQSMFSFTVDNNSIAPATVTFTNLSKNATSYSWDFGNGEISTEENPQVTYNEAGNFTVSLTVGSDNPDLHYNTLTSNKTVVIKSNPVKRLFFGDRVLGVVKYVDLDDSPFPILQQFSHSGIGKPYGMTVDTTNAKVYVTDYRYQFMYRYNVDGSNVEILMSEPTPNFDSPFGIVVIQDMIYWADSAGIHKANLDGTNPQVHIALGPSVPEMPLDLDYDHTNQIFYFSNDKYEFSGGIFRVNFDGTGLTELVSGTNGGAIGIDVANNRMYYFDYDKGMCLNTLDGQNEVVFDASVLGMMTWGLAIDKDGGKIYYSNRVSMNVMRANLDGSVVEVFIPAEAEINPNAMAIDIAR
jgi:PKD repeat protein